MSTGTKQEKREYVEKHMRLIEQKIFALEDRLETLASITPERRKDIEEIAAYLDHGVGRIEAVLDRWDES